MAGEARRPAVNVRYAFYMANDVEAMRRFYSGLLGLEEATYQAGAYLVYQSEGFQLMFFKAEKTLQVPSEWAMQPGWEGGTLEAHSIGIAVPEESFAAVLDRLRADGARLFRPDPEWRQESYWGLSVMDPMGMTVEVYTSPRERPAGTAWPGR